MNIQELIDILNLVENKSLEVFTQDNVFEPTGVNEITTITDLLDGYNKVVGIVIL